MSDTYIMFAWLALLVIMLIGEIATVGLTCIWAAGGALVALILNLLHVPLAGQIIAFFVVTAVLLFFTRPFALKVMNVQREKTNYESVIGKTVCVEERVDNISQTGRANVDGQEWTVRSASDEVTYEVGELVKVVEVAGVKLIVKRDEER